MRYGGGLTMCVKRIEESAELFCYKVTFDDGDVVYYIDTSMHDAAKSANEIMPPKFIEEVGKGAIGC
jgi:hypothetical protein